MKLQVDIPEELKTDLRLFSVRSNKTLSQIAIEAFKEYLEKRGVIPEKAPT